MDSEAGHITIVEFAPQPCAVVRARSDIAGLPAVFGRAIPAIAGAIAAQHVGAVGPPFGIYPSQPEGIFTVVIGLPTTMAPAATAEVEPYLRPGGPAAVTVHVGPFDSLAPTYGAMARWIAEHGHRPGPVVWEEYLTDPATDPDPATWCTRIVWPLDDPTPSTNP